MPLNKKTAYIENKRLTKGEDIMNINPQMLMQFMQFRNSFRGDPQQMVQQMLNSGQISQQQYQNAVQMANQFSQMFTPYGRR